MFRLEAETIFIQEMYLKPDNSEGSDENCEEYGELEIDLDYNDNDQHYIDNRYLLKCYVIMLCSTGV